MKNNLRLVTVLLPALIALPQTAVQAEKPSGGGGGGGGGGDQGVAYSVFRLDDFDGVLTEVIPRAINSSGEVVGQAEDPVTGLVAAYWSTNSNTGSSQLQLLADGLAAYSINVHGEIVGGQVEADGNTIGRYWTESTDNAPLRLMPLTGDEESAAYAINREGVVVGWSQHRITGPDPRPGGNPAKIITLKVERHPVVWRIVDGNAQGPFELPNLLDIDPTTDPDNAYGVAVSLNDNDTQGLATVVGDFMLSEEFTVGNTSPTVTWPTHAARWTIAFDGNGQLVASGAGLAPGASAAHVNNNDVICGSAIASTPSPLAAVWAPGEVILDGLRDVNESAANQINADGLIVGWGWVDSRSESGIRAVMWSNSTSKMIRLDDFLGRRSSLGYLSSAEGVNENGTIVGQAQNGGFVAIPD